MATHGANAAGRVYRSLAPTGTFSKLFVGIMRLFRLEDHAGALIKQFEQILAKINLKAMKALCTGTINSADGAAQLLDSATPIFDWRKVIGGGWKLALFIIFFNLVWLLYEVTFKELTWTGFFKKLAACIASTYASQISGNAVRELCSMAITFFFPASAAHWGFRLLGWALELGTSIVIAHITSKFLNPTKNPDEYFTKYFAQIKKDYDNACKYLKVKSSMSTEGIKKKIDGLLKACNPEDFKDEAQDV